MRGGGQIVQVCERCSPVPGFVLVLDADIRQSDSNTIEILREDRRLRIVSGHKQPQASAPAQAVDVVEISAVGASGARAKREVGCREPKTIGVVEKLRRVAV